MPPRTLNSPGTSTTSARVIPRSSSHRVSSSTGTVSPTATTRDIPFRASGRGTGCIIAWKGATITRGGSCPPNRFNTRSRLPKISSSAISSRGSFSQAGKTSGITPANVATSSRKSSTSPTCAIRITSVVGACSPSAAAVSAAAEPQAPSMVALRPFFSAAMTSGNPDDRWIWRVRSFRPWIGWAATGLVDVRGIACFVQHCLLPTTYCLPRRNFRQRSPIRPCRRGHRNAMAACVATGRQHVGGLDPCRDRPGFRRRRADRAVHGVDQIVEVAGKLQAGDGPAPLARATTARSANPARAITGPVRRARHSRRCPHAASSTGSSQIVSTRVAAEAERFRRRGPGMPPISWSSTASTG